MKHTEPVTHLFLDEGADGFYYVVVAESVVEEIGGDGIETLRQFLDAIETRGEHAEFEVCRIDGAELRAWKEMYAEIGFGVQR
jgi:hypothetical protein